MHFPWCLKKCPYCDFASGSVKREDVPHRVYGEQVRSELGLRATGGRLVSVFFGGGTPSLWASSEVGAVLESIRGAYDEVDPDLEVTLECNPTSIDRDGASALADVGVNRLSIGVQSTTDAHLEFLGRLHDSHGALDALSAVRTVMSRVSADLMFGMRGQSAQAFEREIETILATGVEHVSAYALTIEPGTQFGALHKQGKLTVATEDEFADTFVRAEEAFEKHGLHHYEVSNYCRPGAEARHNQHYWRGGDYLGLGAGAVGVARGTEGLWRYRNHAQPERYMGASSRREMEAFTEPLDAETQVREALMLGLRTEVGVDLEAVAVRTGIDPRGGRIDVIARRVASGDLMIGDGRLWVPRARWLQLDAIVADLF